MLLYELGGFSAGKLGVGEPWNDTDWEETGLTGVDVLSLVPVGLSDAGDSHETISGTGNSQSWNVESEVG